MLTFGIGEMKWIKIDLLLVKHDIFGKLFFLKGKTFSSWKKYINFAAANIFKIVYFFAFC